MSRFDAERMRARLASRERLTVKLDGFRESAVLVPVVCDPDGRDRLLFTVRRSDLPTHAGQISFPGGKRDPDDQDLAQTAIREAAEELGLEPARVEVLGQLDDVPTPTGFIITPVVGRIVGPVSLTPSAREVAEAFAAPIDELASPGCYHHEGTRSFLGVHYDMHEYHFGAHRIWGATARMVYQTLELISASD
jgi:8-oxo-dGTP pyrophosphatase MutT (NUDIX family)